MLGWGGDGLAQERWLYLRLRVCLCQKQGDRDLLFKISSEKVSRKCLLLSVRGKLKCRCLSGVGVSHKVSRPGGQTHLLPSKRQRSFQSPLLPSSCFLAPLPCSKIFFIIPDREWTDNVGVCTVVWLSMEARNPSSYSCRRF